MEVVASYNYLVTEEILYHQFQRSEKGTVGSTWNFSLNLK